MATKGEARWSLNCRVLRENPEPTMHLIDLEIQPQTFNFLPKHKHMKINKN
jgi:hypothetical protein